MTKLSCPVCGGTAPQGIVCSACWRILGRDLGSVPTLLADLEIAASKQARLTPPTPGGLASERDPIGWGAADAAAALGNSLTTWGLDITGERMRPRDAALTLPGWQAEIRRHPAAAELWADITGHVHRARHTIDRQDRHIDVGSCPEPDCGGTLRAHLPAADDRPAGVTCLTNPAHRWTPDQWLRLGRRILATKGPTT